MKDYVSGVLEHSGKMVILMEIIEHCTLLHEKILIFRSALSATSLLTYFHVLLLVICLPYLSSTAVS